jgi:hypothetical protein
MLLSISPQAVEFVENVENGNRAFFANLSISVVAVVVVGVETTWFSWMLDWLRTATKTTTNGENSPCQVTCTANSATVSATT